MHELAIADSIVRIAREHAGDRRVATVALRVGHLRQVVPSALAFAFELVAQGGPVEGARLEVEYVPAAAICRACTSESEFDDFPFACRRCGSFDVELVRGEELLVDSLELEETVPMRDGGDDG